MGSFPMRVMARLGLGISLFLQPAPAHALEIVASIKPVHSLVAAVTRGVVEPTLLIKSAGSPHVHALRPSEARTLERADIVFWVGEGLETFLARPLNTLAADARIVTLIEAEGLSLLRPRESGAWEAHDRHVDNQGRHAKAGEIDMHVWLDPRNGIAMARSIAAVLVEADPDNGPIYRANLARLETDLATLESALGESLRGVRERPYVVFHDAYQYFERRFGLAAVGSITISPETQPGAARLRALQQRIAATGALCVFAEPQFEPRLMATVLEATDARAAVLDPLGAELPAGPDQYFALLGGMAKSLIECLEERAGG